MELKLTNIKKSFEDKEILHGISFSVESGKALGLLGRNGAGKTTTIRIIMDVFRANEGEITLDGEKFVPKSNQIGYLPEERTPRMESFMCIPRRYWKPTTVSNSFQTLS